MLKQLVVATALTCGAAIAYAQSPPSPSPTQMPRNNTASAPAVEPAFEVVDRGAEVGGQRRVGPRHIRIVATSHCPAGRIEARGLAPCGEVGLPSTSEHAAETWAGEPEKIRGPA